jgi:hypothetical protein
MENEPRLLPILPLVRQTAHDNYELWLRLGYHHQIQHQQQDQQPDQQQPQQYHMREIVELHMGQ